MLRAHLTQNWPIDRVMAYGPDVTAALNKLRDKYPKDVAVAPLVEEIIAGNRQLWIVTDDEKDDAFVSFALTKIETNNHTGNKSVVITDLAGEGGTENCPLAADVEAWARDEVEADEVVIVGRVGWRKALAKEGYSAGVMTYRKPLEAGE